MSFSRSTTDAATREAIERGRAAKHTPGPWFVGTKFKAYNHSHATQIEVHDPGCGECGRGKGKGLVAWVFDEALPGLSKTAKANSRLIAAAPDLLAALKNVRKFVLIENGDSRRAVEQLDAAASKAEGRPQ